MFDFTLSISVISLNARGLRDVTKRKALFTFAKSFKTDFVFFQESHSIPSDYAFWRNQWCNDIWFAHGSEHSAGVLILKNNFVGDVLHHFCDKKGHFLMLVVCINNIVVILVNIYGYNVTRDNDLLFETIEDKILLWLNTYPDALIFIGGDFNMVPDNQMDRLPPKRSTSVNTKLKIFMDKFNVIDIWREIFPNTKSYTWSNKSCSRQSRIDYWLVSQCVKNFKATTSILPSPLTDHKAILLQSPLSSDNIFSGPRASYWKLNSSLLTHDQVKIKISFLIKYYWLKAKKDNKYGLNWELLKHEIGKCARKFGTQLAKLKKQEEESIVYKIIYLHNKVQDGLSEAEFQELSELQTKLDLIYKYRAEGSFIRSRRRWLEQGEQSTAYFFRMEKNNSRNLTINSLNIDGTESSDPKQIATFCANFYTNLYKSKYCDDSAQLFFQSLKGTKTLSINETDTCDRHITAAEIIESIEALKNNKSPGTDGLTAEFYKMFAQDLAPFLLKMFLESIESEALPSTLSQGLLTLIPKPKKDILFIDNWRPICLLNCDYKILALLLANRLKSVLGTIIDETQTGFIPKRHISNNIRLVLDLLDYAELVKEESFILFLDFYKAFDSLEHNFILQSLRKFNFGDFFL